MRREYDKAVVLHVDEHHHHIVFASVRSAKLPAAVAVVEGRLVAVVPVGNVKLPVFEVCADGADGFGVVHHPHAVRDGAVGKFVARLSGGKRVKAGSRRVRFVHVKRVDLAEVAAGRFHQAEAVFLRFGKRFFMRKDDAL